MGDSFDAIFAGAFLLCVLLASLFLSLASCLCNYMYNPNDPGHRNSFPGTDAQSFVDIEAALDGSTLHSFPKLLYSQYKLQKNSSTASCCSICLMDYKETDMLQSLPYCGHLFHLKCVKPWLRLHPSCPLCRKSQIPVPMTLLVQVPTSATSQE